MRWSRRRGKDTARPSCPQTAFLALSIHKLTFPACPYLGRQRRLIVNGRVLPLGAWARAVCKAFDSGHLCSSDSHKACTQNLPLSLPETSKHFLFKKKRKKKEDCPELGNPGSGGNWEQPGLSRNEFFTQVRGRERFFSERTVPSHLSTFPLKTRVCVCVCVVHE